MKLQTVKRTTTATITLDSQEALYVATMFEVIDHERPPDILRGIMDIGDIHMTILDFRQLVDRMKNS